MAYRMFGGTNVDTNLYQFELIKLVWLAICFFLLRVWYHYDRIPLNFGWTFQIDLKVHGTVCVVACMLAFRRVDEIALKIRWALTIYKYFSWTFYVYLFWSYRCKKQTHFYPSGWQFGRCWKLMDSFGLGSLSAGVCFGNTKIMRISMEIHPKKTKTASNHTKCPTFWLFDWYFTFFGTFRLFLFGFSSKMLTIRLFYPKFSQFCPQASSIKFREVFEYFRRKLK